MTAERLQMSEVRKRLGLSQLELADRVGLSQKHISWIENGIRDPSLERAKRIAKELGVTVEEIF